MVERNNNMTITTANYLDFQNLIVNEVIGSVALTYMIGLIIILAWAYKRQLQTNELVIAILVYTALIGITLGNLFLIIMALVLSLIYYGQYKRMTGV